MKNGFTLVELLAVIVLMAIIGAVGLFGVSAVNKNIKTIASDINEGPLKQAENNIKKENLEGKIELRLGDGLDTYTKEVDTVIISGMGGRNIIGICKKNHKVLKNIKL